MEKGMKTNFTFYNYLILYPHYCIVLEIIPFNHFNNTKGANLPH